VDPLHEVEVIAMRGAAVPHVLPLLLLHVPESVSETAIGTFIHSLILSLTLFICIRIEFKKKKYSFNVM
jgi:hypothetical protein